MKDVSVIGRFNMNFSYCRSCFPAQRYKLFQSSEYVLFISFKDSPTVQDVVLTKPSIEVRMAM